MAIKVVAIALMADDGMTSQMVLDLASQVAMAGALICSVGQPVKSSDVKTRSHLMTALCGLLSLAIHLPLGFLEL
jgi:hypothetical protein